MNQITLYGIKISRVGFSDALELVDDKIRRKGKGYIVTPNVDHITKLQNNREFSKAYEDAFLVLADGAPLITVSRLVGKPLSERVSGADLFPKMLDLAAKKGYGIFLLGASKDVNSLAKDKIKKEYPGIPDVQGYSPPFGFEKDEKENGKTLDLINKSRAQILFIFLGAPKQELWIHNNLDKISINIAVCLGASLDFYAGKVSRAPRALQKLGMEWLWRIITDPKRLAKRYLVDDMFPFIMLTFKELGKKDSQEAEKSKKFMY